MDGFSRVRSFVGPACLALVVVLTLTRCASTETAAPEDASPTERAPLGPPLFLLYTDDEGMHAHDVRTDTVTTLAKDVQFAGARAVSPSGRYLAVSYIADSSRLGIVDLRAQTLRAVHAHPEAVTYSVAWHATDDTLAFGVYTPADDGARGPGSIRRVVPDGESQPVGCRAAREVLAWLPDGTLATRDDDTLYLVDAGDCETQARLDVRKMHRLTYAADGSHLAYILRDLSYDRSAGEYVPDSSLYVSAPDGSRAEKLFGDERAVRHLRWAPKGAKLTFDLRDEETSQRRAVVYNATEDRTSYVVPPSGSTADEVHPRWAPDATHVAFLLRSATSQRAAVRIAGRTQTLGASTGPVWGWADDRHVVVPGRDSLRVMTVQGQSVYALPRGTTLLYANMRQGNV